MKPLEVFIPKQIWTLIMSHAAKFSGKHGDEKLSAYMLIDVLERGFPADI